jgi:outer membrane protein
VGSILELMNTQAALANARQKRIQAITDWHYARVDLVSKLGRLDAADVQNR